MRVCRRVVRPRRPGRAGHPPDAVASAPRLARPDMPSHRLDGPILRPGRVSAWPVAPALPSTGMRNGAACSGRARVSAAGTDATIRTGPGPGPSLPRVPLAVPTWGSASGTYRRRDGAGVAGTLVDKTASAPGRGAWGLAPIRTAGTRLCTRLLRGPETGDRSGPSARGIEDRARGRLNLAGKPGLLGEWGSVASGHGASAKAWWRTTATTATLSEAVRENEEVVPVNVSTWVLPSGVMVGR